MEPEKPTVQIFVQALLRNVWTYVAATSVLLTVVLLPPRWRPAIPWVICALIVLAAFHTIRLLRQQWAVERARLGQEIATLSQEVERLKAAPVDDIQRRVDAVEVLSSIQQGLAHSFQILVKNDSDEVVAVRDILLESEKHIRLTDPPPPSEGRWMIQPRNKLSIEWRAQPDPAAELITLNQGWGKRQFETAMHILLVCEVLGRIKKCDSKIWVQVDVPNRRIRQIAG